MTQASNFRDKTLPDDSESDDMIESSAMKSIDDFSNVIPTLSYKQKEDIRDHIENNRATSECSFLS